jgi:hypothetical protein
MRLCYFSYFHYSFLLLVHVIQDIIKVCTFFISYTALFQQDFSVIYCVLEYLCSLKFSIATSL